MEATIEKLDKIKDHVQKKRESTRIELININGIDFNEQSGAVTYSSLTLEDNAITQLFNIIGVKRRLKDEISETTPDLWLQFRDAVKRLYAGTTLIAVVDVNRSRIKQIIHSNHNVEVFNALTVLDKVKVAVMELSASKTDLNLVSWAYDHNRANLKIDFVLPDNTFEVFGDYKGNADIWDMGISLDVSNTKIDVSEFYYRLVCTNGMVRDEKISKATYKNNFISKLDGKLIRAFKNSYDKSIEYIKGKAALMVENNLSLNEYYNIIGQIEGMNAKADGMYTDIINSKFVPWGSIINDYQNKGHLLNEKSEGWLRTANSGVNAYEAFNALTDVSSHRSIYNKIKEEDRESMQTLANELLFAKGYDMANIAPKIDLAYSLNEV